MIQTAYLSSTYQDLIEHREAVYKALSKMKITVRAMEDYVARDSLMVDQVLKDVAACDIYLGIFARRYGHVPPLGNPDGLSVTEFEYRKAVEMKKPCLIFLLAPTEIWPKEYVDSETGENGGGARIEKLRDELSNRMCSLFTTPHNLVEMAQAAVHLTAVDAKSLALPDDPNSASCLSMKGSGVAGIITDISRVIKEEIKADIAKVNLGSGRSWWSTRLHLFSALCADYTDVRQLLFETEEYRFLGMCKPSQARRFLAQSFQNVEIAYRESLPPPGFNPADEVSPIVDQFSIAMDKLGGEQNVMRWVEPHLIQNWPGVNKDCVEMPVEGVTPALLKSVVGCQTPFVVLVRNGIILKIVDRTALATRIALIAIGRTGG